MVTHRNPLVTLPLLCRIMESLCIAFDRDGSFDKHQFAQLIRLIREKYIMVPLNYRKAHTENEVRIIDCIYEELFSGPKHKIPLSNAYDHRLKLKLLVNYFD